MIKLLLDMRSAPSQLTMGIDIGAGENPAELKAIEALAAIIKPVLLGRYSVPAEPADEAALTSSASAHARLLAQQARALFIKAAICSDPLVSERLLEEARQLKIRSARIADPRNSSTSHPSPPKPPIG